MADNENTSVTKDLGIVSAYGYAKAAGYTGTEEEFEEIFLEFTENAPGLLDRLDDAVDAAEAAQTAAESAETAAESAQTAAETAAATFTTDKTLAVSDKAADAKVTGDEITGLKTAITQLNGDQYITVTDFSGTFTPATGVTASIENGKLKLYGTSSQNRRFLCLNGQKVSATTSTAFAQTLPKGIYNNSIKITGYNTSVSFQYTTSTFAGTLHAFPNNGTLNTNDPIMVGLFISNGANFGTSENPTYIDVKITYYAEKANKTDVTALYAWKDSKVPYKYLGTANDTDLNTLFNTGWYDWTSLHVPTNSPFTGVGGRVLNIGNATDGNGIQIAFAVDNAPRMFMRRKSSSEWNGWIELTDETLPSYNYLKTLFDENNLITSSGYLDFTINAHETRPIVISISAKYSGVDKPYIYFQCFARNGQRIYSSCRYMFHSSTEYVEQEFRIPNAYEISRFRIYITIPEDSSLSVYGFKCSYEDSTRAGIGNIEFDAHRGADTALPAGSYNAVVTAAKLGFNSCIAIPKFTSDGVAVEFHDDGNISSAMTQTDGTAIPEEYNKPISQLTYSKLMEYSIGYSYNPIFANYKILTIEDFLKICAKTGMRPMFSIHSAAAPTTEQWQTLKAMTDKYGLTKQLSIITGSGSVCGNVINTFGNGNFHSLILIYDQDSEDNILDRISDWETNRGLDTSKTNVICEFYQTALRDATTGTAQTAQLQAALGAGYKVSAVLAHGTDETTDGIEELMNMGVTEFCNQRMYSMNLNW